MNVPRGVEMLVELTCPEFPKEPLRLNELLPDRVNEPEDGAADREPPKLPPDPNDPPPRLNPPPKPPLRPKPPRRCAEAEDNPPRTSTETANTVMNRDLKLCFIR
jgi:hypothetical protein